MNNKIKAAVAVLSLAGATTYANPNLLDSSWAAFNNVAQGENSQTIATIPGDTYDLTFNYQGWGGIPPTVYVYWDWNSANEYIAYVGLSEGNKIDVNVDVKGSGSDEMYVDIEGNGPNGPVGVYLNDWSLVQVDSNVPDAASSSALLGVGLLGLAGLRRKLS